MRFTGKHISKILKIYSCVLNSVIRQIPETYQKSKVLGIWSGRISHQPINDIDFLNAVVGSGIEVHGE